MNYVYDYHVYYYDILFMSVVVIIGTIIIACITLMILAELQDAVVGAVLGLHLPDVAFAQARGHTARPHPQ